MDNRKIYEVDKIHVITDRQYVIVHLKGTTWENRYYKEISLVIGEKRYLFRYVGFGNMNGTLVIRLIPQNDADISKLDKQCSGKVFIEVE